jgi:glyceraldehyde 3-phosphate dehydrogenase
MLNAAGKNRWYDNEWAYSCRVMDLAEYMVKKGI